MVGVGSDLLLSCYFIFCPVVPGWVLTSRMWFKHKVRSNVSVKARIAFILDGLVRFIYSIKELTLVVNG